MIDSSTPRLRPMGLGDILDEAFSLYRRNFVLFAGIVAVLAIPQAILNIATNATTKSTAFHITSAPGQVYQYHYNFAATGVTGLLTIIFSPLITGALAKAISSRYLGRSITILEAYSSIGLGTFVVLLIASILYGIVVVIGLVILLVPGIFLYVRLAFVAQAVVLEHQGVDSSLGRSSNLVEGSWWRVFGILLVLTIIVGALQNAFGFIGGVFLISGHAAVGIAISAVVGILVQPIQLGGATLLYYDLRIRKEGFDIEVATQALETGQSL